MESNNAAKQMEAYVNSRKVSREQADQMRKEPNLKTDDKTKSFKIKVKQSEKPHGNQQRVSHSNTRIHSKHTSSDGVTSSAQGVKLKKSESLSSQKNRDINSPKNTKSRNNQSGQISSRSSFKSNLSSARRKSSPKRPKKHKSPYSPNTRSPDQRSPRSPGSDQSKKSNVSITNAMPVMDRETSQISMAQKQKSLYRHPLPKEGDVWKPIAHNYGERKAVFKEGYMYVNDIKDIVYDRNTSFHKLFQGTKIPEDKMFFRLTKYTPSGFPKKVPLNHKNKTEYNKMVDANLKAKKQFMEW